MDQNNRLPFPYGRAICYSGFREGQHPGGEYPAYEQVREDLLMLQGHWKYLRLYDCDPHAETVLQVIQQEKLDFKVMQGAYIEAEMNNYGCPWGGGVYSEEQLEANKAKNDAQIDKLIKWANAYPDIICCTSAGNEACVDWTDHYVPVGRVIAFVRRLKAATEQPVTFCENYVPWMHKLRPLAQEVDFISIHTYPVWEYKHIHESLEYTKENYYGVANLYPDTPVVITEAGWTTRSNGQGIDPGHVNETLQKTYYDDLMGWTDAEEILTFVFEAFDEPWKGSPDPMEPEKHWGLFRVDRSPKLVVQGLLAGR
ncbi:glycosyl hydrolase family 17 protein [Phaeodactylibacter xiamenensis]|jgi:exo-beta-1,3-glucanase (GH17 family)|uniref:glycosyl hydrolase family 17 protein n=1 Tax=Phaeodactylibacter xiamenensis TaxID=1524460 RepID=UPI0024A92085|nr:glycosyl hydrolase family 17 protein [Phaeodactylibacter xiamenensis]